MSASFGEEIASGLKESKSVWSVDAVYKDVSGTANMTEDETAEVTAVLSQAGKLFNSIDKSTFHGITENEELLTRVKTYVNTKVRAGERIKDPSAFVTGLMEFIYDYYQKEMDKLKTDKNKDAKTVKRKEILSYFSNTL
jgi:hypothetical protein